MGLFTSTLTRFIVAATEPYLVGMAEAFNQVQPIKKPIVELVVTDAVTLDPDIGTVYDLTVGGAITLTVAPSLINTYTEILVYAHTHAAGCFVTLPDSSTYAMAANQTMLWRFHIRKDLPTIAERISTSLS